MSASGSFTSVPTSPPVPPTDWLLIVDDEPPILEMLAAALEQENLRIVTATDAASALQHLAEQPRPPLLALVDVVLRGVDGLTLARTLQSRLSASRIVIMSGRLTTESWWPEDLRDLKFINKPFQMAALQALVDEARARSR